MPVKNLYWIDDSTHDMYLIMEHVFPVLWDENCSCKTILFGNDYCSKETENGPSEKDRKEFETDLRGFFTIYCQEIDNQEWEDLGTTYKKKQLLLSDPLVSLVPLEDSTWDLAQCWLDRNILEGANKRPEHLPSLPVDSDHVEHEDSGAAPVKSEVKEVCLSVDQLIEAMNIPEDAAVALDICLLYHDIDRIEAGLPSISMALYDGLLERNHRCYLYSNRTIARTAMAQWVKTFQKLFPDSAKELNDTIIHPKVGLLATRPDTAEKTALVNLLQGKD